VVVVVVLVCGGGNGEFGGEMVRCRRRWIPVEMMVLDLKCSFFIYFFGFVRFDEKK
jgi:hypothetical protein